MVMIVFSLLKFKLFFFDSGLQLLNFTLKDFIFDWSPRVTILLVLFDDIEEMLIFNLKLLHLSLEFSNSLPELPPSIFVLYFLLTSIVLFYHLDYLSQLLYCLLLRFQQL